MKMYWSGFQRLSTLPDDPGKIGYMYLWGSLGWAKNLLSKKDRRFYHLPRNWRNSISKLPPPMLYCGGWHFIDFRATFSPT